MKKLLLSLFCIIAASLAANADVTLDVSKNTNSWMPTSSQTKESTTPAGWPASFTTNAYFNTSYLFIKTNGSVTITPDINVSEIVMKTSNNTVAAKGKMTISYSGKTLGTAETAVGTKNTEFTFKSEGVVIPANTPITFKATGANTQFVQIKFVEAVVEGPQDFNPGFEANYTLQEGEIVNLAENWPENAPTVNYTVDPEDYILIDQNTLGAYEAIENVNVNYSWDATEDWNAGSGSFSVKVIAPKTKVTMLLGETALTANIGEDVTNELLIEPEDALQYVKATSSASKIAKYYPETGKVECLSVGTATITLSFTENDAYEYTGEELTFTVTVSDPNTVQFDFATKQYDLKATSDGNAYYNGNNTLIEGTNPEVKVHIDGAYRYWNSGKDLRIYTEHIVNNEVIPTAKMTISVPENYYITGIDFGAGSNVNNDNINSINVGKLTSTNAWGDSDSKYPSSVEFIPKKGTTIKSITVHFAERPVVAEPVIDFGVKTNDDGSIAHHTVLINETEDDATYEAYIDYEDGLQGETKLAFNNGKFDPIMVWKTAHHKHTSIQPAHIYNVTVLASKPGAQTKRADKQFITAPRISKVEEPATRATDKDITVTMHVSDPRVNMFYSIDGATEQTYNDGDKITVPANSTITARAESKDGSLKSAEQTLKNDGVFSGVEEIVAADADAKWYDLQGRAVNAERLAPGIYVKVNGKKAVKVVVK